MKTFFTKGIFLLLALQGLARLGCSQSQTDLTVYCPDSGEVGEWFAEYEPRIASGNDLFLLINGGADIYLEYGFEKAIFHSYKLPEGGAINLEMYQMKTPASAYGIYTFKSGDTGEHLDVGHDGWMEDYFLNFWKGDILVTLIALDTDEETLNGIRDLARSIDGKIKRKGTLPELVNRLPEYGLKPNGTTYLRGNLALFNQYLFDSRNVFGFAEGVKGSYTEYDLFLFTYNSPEEAKEWYKSAMDLLSKNGLFKDLSSEKNFFRMTDNNDQIVIIKPVTNYLAIYIGPPDRDYTSILDKIDFE
jgi:hypothetical protein